MNVGSLFSGIGGIDLGLERAGMEVRWQVENDRWCQQILAKHWPDVPRYGDIHDVKGNDLEPVDLICGGFPCQPVSLAGKREHKEDSRWLWPEYLRIVTEMRPRWVLIENVQGLRTKGLQDVLEGLADSGYDAEWDCIPAAAFGAPHIRFRYFIVAYPRSAGDVAYPDNSGCEWRQQLAQGRESSRYVADTQGTRFAQSGRAFGRAAAHARFTNSGWWAVEPDMGRVANGIPRRVDRLRGLGNAVVPQAVEWVGRQIMEAA